MQITPDPELMKEILARIREGMVEGVREEMDRRRRLGIPIYIQRNGEVEMIPADQIDSTINPTMSTGHDNVAK